MHTTIGYHCSLILSSGVRVKGVDKLVAPPLEPAPSAAKGRHMPRQVERYEFMKLAYGALQPLMRFEYCSLFSRFVCGVESCAVFADSARRKIARAEGHKTGGLRFQ